MSITPVELVNGFNQVGTFTCLGFGIPVPSLVWTWSEGNTGRFTIASTTEGTSTLTIPDTGAADEGTFTCTGSNGVRNLIGSPEVAEAIFALEGETTNPSYLPACLYDFNSSTSSDISQYIAGDWTAQSTDHSKLLIQSRSQCCPRWCYMDLCWLASRSHG